MADPLVRDNPEQTRMEIVVDGAVAGYVEYRGGPDVLDLRHTEIDSAYEGQGLGGKLARGVLDAVRRADQKVIPTCPFIKGWIEKHEDYKDLVVG
ncbi:MAG TPA: GNAT family N-acetyltransferase [Acidimicrobiales bacterium]|nr:GNAT family N-acetyltransferase [Acidimicrobiales bacterium]